MASQPITAHLPTDLVERLDQFADRLERSRGWIVKQAVRDWLEREAERDGLTAEALDSADARPRGVRPRRDRGQREPHRGIRVASGVDRAVDLACGFVVRPLGRASNVLAARPVGVTRRFLI